MITSTFSSCLLYKHLQRWGGELLINSVILIYEIFHIRHMVENHLWGPHNTMAPTKKKWNKLNGSKLILSFNYWFVLMYACIWVCAWVHTHLWCGCEGQRSISEPSSTTFYFSCWDKVPMKWRSPFQMASELPNIHVQKLTVSGNATHFTRCASFIWMMGIRSLVQQVLYPLNLTHSPIYCFIFFHES